MKKSTMILFLLHSIILYTFLYLPIIITILFSFSGSKIQKVPIDSLTLNWYVELFQDSQLWTSAKNSILVSIPATVLAMVLGTIAAFLFQRYKMHGGKVLQVLILLPYVLPGIILGVSLSLFYKFLDVEASLISVAIGHITFITPVVMFLVMDRLKRFDQNLELASMDLGATAFVTFFRVTLPNIKGALIAGALLGFTISFDEIIVTFFLIGNQPTLPLKIWAMIKFGYSPQINAIYTLIVVASLLIIILSGRRLFAKN